MLDILFRLFCYNCSLSLLSYLEFRSVDHERVMRTKLVIYIFIAIYMYMYISYLTCVISFLIDNLSYIFVINWKPKNNTLVRRKNWQQRTQNYMPVHFPWLVQALQGIGLLCLTPLSALKVISRLVSFIGGGNWSSRRKPRICRKSLTNFITHLAWASGTSIQSDCFVVKDNNTCDIPHVMYSLNLFKTNYLL